MSAIRRRILIAATVAALATVPLTACGGSGGSSPATPTCSSLQGRADWYPAMARADGCLQNGSLQVLAGFACRHGVRLAQFGDHPAWWGFSNGLLHRAAHDNAGTDPRYGRAYRRCVG